MIAHPNTPFSLLKRECPFCHEHIVLDTRRSNDNTLYLVDASIHVCQDCPFEIGNEIRGFSFAGEGEVHGAITDIIPVVCYEYHLDTGAVIGTHDDVYTRKGKPENDV